MTHSKNIKESTNKKRKNLTRDKVKKKKLKITKSKEKIQNNDSTSNDPNILDPKQELELNNVQREKRKNLDILKKGKIFVDKDTMMKLIDQLNEKEDERIEDKLQRQNNLEQIIKDRQIKQQHNRSIRKEKIENAKQLIKNRKKGRKEGRKEGIKIDKNL
ncbi:uncharacterized protein OCT59_009658 [Rhizophagus irregularis]|uniref:Ribosomal RNA-processing protein 14/surfeit locus protein 6 C-terminal domain-containing protein n=2 Tax=Rhizophagus irregularis TaxID=588596 RepID=A0A015KIX7_RHIIW|nr:hypothetical protein GLOIN_2v1488324 [Rhizophagus irregularis DAOM 181602=DAOM 197198]EXX67534.1 hypothetical protein RirG_113490 [Rhizophagus irregularis DAOM 197198w]POG58802.1 hypothetical protein GLOIN_2v1488324 [Rhizophagus irregularis DAOM 181602=DAOM 197198]UZO18343.1 hypothetical protein OCT59_009658 [Rhizophagus irregularis]GBC15458.1 hypothetical protein GLOIN_2v1488324 [Rhizophagus irregularis DAOM 181602=DAOM 197198]|eukprot:XP_025165668.1 hypothetical protein GLOIN_2v1488324 [Rhizophagus irregularis DAOM 181602=DAOM 197198]